MTGKTLIKTIKTLLILFLAGFTVAFSFWFAFRIYKLFWDLPTEVEVPNLVGEDANVADTVLKTKGLILRIIDSKYQEKYPSNTIIKQDPPPGIMVRKGREILTVVSLGPEMMEVPDLRGLSLRDSKVLLGNNKLKAGKITKITKASAEPGEILEQSPSPGDPVSRGTDINLTVNKGDEPMVKVPALISENIVEAQNKIDSANLELGTVIWEWHDYVPKGEVFRQIPSPKSMVQPRTRIDLKVSGGQKGFELNLKQKDLVLFAPKGEGLQTVKLKQVDEFGDRMIYEGKHPPGGKVAITLHCWGDSEIQIYFNTKLAKRIRF